MIKLYIKLLCSASKPNHFECQSSFSSFLSRLSFSFVYRFFWLSKLASQLNRHFPSCLHCPDIQTSRWSVSFSNYLSGCLYIYLMVQAVVRVIQTICWAIQTFFVAIQTVSLTIVTVYSVVYIVHPVVQLIYLAIYTISVWVSTRSVYLVSCCLDSFSGHRHWSSSELNFCLQSRLSRQSGCKDSLSRFLDCLSAFQTLYLVTYTVCLMFWTIILIIQTIYLAAQIVRLSRYFIWMSGLYSIWLITLSIWQFSRSIQVSRLRLSDFLGFLSRLSFLLSRKYCCLPKLFFQQTKKQFDGPDS